MDSDGDVVVLVGANLWLFNPAALEDLTDGEAPVRRNDTPAGATGKMGLRLVLTSDEVENENADR